MVQRSPSPRPSPPGEGETFAVPGRNRRLGFLCGRWSEEAAHGVIAAHRSALPLPGGEGRGENSPNAISRSEPLNRDLGSGSARVSPATSFAADSNEPARRRRSRVHGELRPPTMDAYRGHEPHQNPSPGLRPPSPHPMGRGQGEGTVHGKDERNTNFAPFAKP